MRAVLDIVAAGALLFAAGVGAAPLAPASYDMPNGNGVASSGEFNYWDLGYTGSGATTVDNAALSGGLGDLTDGVTTTQNWFQIENAAGSGPYVGWRAAIMPAPPTVVFHFTHAVDVSDIVVHADDSDGAGGVREPASIRLVAGAFDQTFAIPAHSGAEPFAIDLAGLHGAALGISGVTSLALTFTRNAPDEWVFIDEVSFDGQLSAVPLPGAVGLLLSALPLLALRRRARA